MIQEFCPVTNVENVTANIFILTFVSARIAHSIQPGQFVNIKTDEGIEPLLRRPFSVYHTEGEKVRIIFNVVGKGTEVLKRKHQGDVLDVLGPLGVPFSLQLPSFDHAILLGGGLGVAPLPLAPRELIRREKTILTILGARSSSLIVDRYLQNVVIATDDGSAGLRGNVVDALRFRIPELDAARTRVFACGPTPMLRALQKLLVEEGIEGEAALEGPMGCGFGICQGCPVELVGDERKYALMCKEGPTFDLRRIKL
jgi:dihydroorotate dehydrogenase electron transfer subunit